MKKIRNILPYVIILFVVETLLQIIFYSIRVKYFDKYNLYEKFDKILLNALYVIGTVKVTFFLPLYLIFYLFIAEKKNSLSAIRRSVYHSIIFLLIYLLLSFVLPGDLANRVIDTIIVTFIAFTTSFLLAGKIYRVFVGNQHASKTIN